MKIIRAYGAESGNLSGKRKESMKKIVNMVLCVMLLFAMTVPAYAEETAESQPVKETTAVPTETRHVCSFELTSDTASCTEAGIKTYTCSNADCGETKTENSPAKGHSYGSAVKVDDANHKSVCSACEAESVTGHTWDAGAVTREANCIQSGIKTYTCTGCSHTKTESIPMETTHDYGEWTKSGTGHSRVCDDCLIEDSGKHDWKEEIVKKPTCEEEGSRKKTCTVCGYSESIVIPKLTTHTYDSACDEECNVCGLIRSIEHTFTKVWSKSYKGHWHECTKCGEQEDFAKHIPGPAATEENEQVCVACGYVIMPKKTHTHSYGSEWTSDEAGHWHACTGCKEEKNYASHTFDNACDSECNTCGYKRENTHTYDTEGWLTSSFEHWNVCSVCGEESKHEKHIPGAEATEDTPQTCTVCKYELAPMLEHTHDFGTTWIQAQDSHWQECKCGERSVPVPHVWDAGKENSKNTITYTCVDCGAEKTEEVKSSGFPWLIVLLVLLALVCLGGIAALVIILKRGGFEDASDDEEEYEEEAADESGEDNEEKMIDDYFANLDQETYK